MKKRNILIGAAAAAAFGGIGIAAYAGNMQHETVLEFGMFAGSNWDVANANSFVIIDKAIELFEKEHFDYVINFAAESHVDRSIENPEIFLETKIKQQLLLLKEYLVY